MPIEPIILPITLGAALLAGLLGSGHCLGMCGPIAALPGAALPGPGVSKPMRRQVSRTLLYNSGRLLSYATIGALFGGLGRALGSAALIAQWALVLRVGMGIILLLIGLQIVLPRLRANPLSRSMEWIGSHFWRRLAPIARRLQPGERTSHLFALGLLWGWLPCGLVYSMLALAAVSGSAINGATTMIAFGIGTLPALVGIGVASRGMSILRRPNTQRVVGAALIASGLWIAAMPLQHSLMMPGSHQHHATPP